MFKIDSQSLPFVRTRQALIILDLQNDFVSEEGRLRIQTPPDFEERILKLVPEFRALDTIIWVRSMFETSRAVNEAESESESVITDKQLPARRSGAVQRLRGRGRISKKLLDAYEKVAEANGGPLEGSPLLADNKEEPEIEETFLTLNHDQSPRIVLTTSTGTNFSLAASKCIDGKKDLVFQKSWYSAFKDGKLVQVLRARFVTGIYLCGSLTNISVFATAMDAARHGYKITIVEDCIGYRSKARHDEALRKLIEFTGCDIVNSEDIVQELRAKAKKQQEPPSTHSRPPIRQKSSELEGLMSKLNLGPEARSASPQRMIPTAPAISVADPESPGTTKSSKPGDESPDSKLPPKPEIIRERVKTKIKTRRRHSKSAPRETAGPSGESEKGQSSPTTTVTLDAASKALEKLPAKQVESSTTVTSEVSSTEQEKPAMKLDTEDQSKDLSADQWAEREKEASLEAGLTPLCEGDTTIIPDILDAELAKGVFETVRDGVRWQKMGHHDGDVPRLVAVQGEVGEDGSVPLYRHPSDESPPLLPFSPIVSLIRAQVERKLGHSVNHALIQFYRDGTDYISEHSDKTLDIVPKTYIANVSLGAQRTMVFRTKKASKSGDVSAPGPEAAPPRHATRAPLPHNSMCKMGLVTNMRWLHGIRQDKRMPSEKSDEELAFDGGRISLTFRSIGTFLDKDQQRIWGQGATAKTKADARTVINGNSVESEKMIRAFGKENHSSEFNWEESYGVGFDVLHISNSPKLFLSGDFVADSRAKILLAQYNIAWVEGSLSPSFNWKSGNTSIDVAAIPEKLPVKFVDNDLGKSTVIGDLAIMLYLSSVYGVNCPTKSQADLARQFTRLQQAEEVLKKWRARPFSDELFRSELELWETFAAENQFIAGATISLADYALWPVLREIWDDWRHLDGLPNLLAYYRRMEKIQSVMKAVGPLPIRIKE